MPDFRFSVIIPLYNYANTIERAVCSLVKQDIGADNYEIVVVNDGSTDNSEELIRQLIANYPNYDISIYNQKNAGPAAARNLGIDKAQHEYLLFLDADDELLPNALSLFSESIISNACPVVIAGHISQTREAEKYHNYGRVRENPLARIEDYLINKKLKISSGAICFQRSVLYYRFPENFRSSEDIAVFTWAIGQFSVSTIDKATVKIHKHMDSLRHDSCAAKSVGMNLIETLKQVPFSDIDRVQYLKVIARYEQRRLLSLFRTFYLSKHYSLARSYYISALKKNRKIIFQPAYLRKFIASYFKR